LSVIMLSLIDGQLEQMTACSHRGTGGPQVVA
jgi:hypothetical protein